MTRFFVPFAPFLFSLGALSANSAAAAQLQSCPYALHVSARFGILKVDELVDGSYALVSGSQFEGDFVRDLNTRECLLVESIPSQGKQRFVGIKKNRKGNVLAYIEGYTASGKLFSIRVPLDSRSPVDGEFRGTVYENSGTARRVLGEAQVSLSVLTAAGHEF